MNRVSRRMSNWKYAAPLGVICCVAHAAAAPPKLRLDEVQRVSPEQYRVELRLDPARPDFSGEIRMRIRVPEPVDTIWLNASRLSIENAALTSSGKTLSARAIPGGDDFIGLQFPSPVPAGTAELSIRYTGAIRRGDSSGIFQLEDNGNHYLITQFEATDARDAFPCFDEPSYKVPWQITLHVPAADQAVGNTPAESDTVKDGLRTVTFRSTRPLPSYLIAFAVGPFEFVDAGVAGSKRVPVRIVTPKGKAAQAKYAAEVTATIIGRLESYFGIPYPFEKADQLAVPLTVGFGAMENPGLVTYNQTTLLADPENDSIRRQRRYASIAAHELAHQWFGDLVTAAWWDDIWLNEAFATWMEQKLLAEWKPEWNTRVEDVASKLRAASEDSLATARKIRQEIASKGDIDNAFDGITYEKGASVIGMFESWMGADAFRRGVQSYLKQYSDRNATAGEFLDSLSSASKKDVSGAFSTFLNQPGVPTLSVSLDCSNAPTLRLAQSRFLPLGSKGSPAELWSIPVCVRYGSGGGECTLLTSRTMDWKLQTNTCPAWVDANRDAHGYYRVDYGGGLLASLVSGDVSGRLNPAERSDLAGNVQAMANAGKTPIGDALHLAEVFRNDADRDVVETALGIATSIDRDLVPGDLRPNYQRFLRQTFGERARQLGWVAPAGESDDRRLLRPSLVSTVATLGGDMDLAHEAGQLTEKWLRDPKVLAPDIVQAVLGTAAYYGDLALFRRFLAEFEKSKDVQNKRRLLAAMAEFRDPAAIRTGMEEVLSGRIRLVDGMNLLRAGQKWRATSKIGFDFLRAHFDEIMKGNPSVFGFSLGAVLPRTGEGMCDAGARRELEAYFRPIAGRYEGAARNLAQTLETIDLCIVRVNAQSAGVKEFLEKY